MNGDFYYAIEFKYLTKPKTIKMKTNTKTLFLLALIAILFSCNQGAVASDKSVNEVSTPDDEKPDKKISMESKAMASDFVLAGSFIVGPNLFQAVYSSQNYDTFYQIYCKPHLDTDNEKVNFLEFKIVNYKGPLNIGFAENPLTKLENEYNKEDGILGLKLVVKGNSTLDSLKIDVSEKDIIKKNFKGLNIFRILESMYDDVAISNGGIFDSEFYTRSGGMNTHIKKKLVPGLEGYEDNNECRDADQDEGFNMVRLLEPIRDEKNVITHWGASRNCYSAKNIVSWY